MWKHTYLPSQSAPTILVLKTWVGLWPWKKRSKVWVAKSRVQKNRVIVIQKEKMPGCLFSFLNKNDPVFCTLHLAIHILDLFFQGHKPTHVFKTRIVGADCYASNSVRLWHHNLPTLPQPKRLCRGTNTTTRHCWCQSVNAFDGSLFAGFLRP